MQFFLWNAYCWLQRWICCCCHRRAKPRRTFPMHWQPSITFISVLVLAPSTAWYVTLTCFSFSATPFMLNITYSDRPNYSEIVLPPLEQAEVDAGNVNSERIFIPLMNRYLVFLVISWILHLFILEPLLLLFHLFLGEPTIDESINFI